MKFPFVAIGIAAIGATAIIFIVTMISSASPRYEVSQPDLRKYEYVRLTPENFIGNHTLSVGQRTDTLIIVGTNPPDSVTVIWIVPDRATTDYPTRTVTVGETLKNCEVFVTLEKISGNAATFAFQDSGQRCPICVVQGIYMHMNITAFK